MKGINDKLVMIFVRNLVLGKVKTRISQKLGDNAALEIYRTLLLFTEKVVRYLPECDKAVFYSDFIENKDMWHHVVYQKYVQKGEELGERMKNAFEFAFSKKYEKVIIIGSDCAEISDSIIEDAFYELNSNDVVLGPAKDGGYYMLGMKQMHKELFEDIPWSTKNVLLDTINICKKLNLKYHLHPVLSDIDTVEDVKVLNKLKLYPK